MDKIRKIIRKILIVLLVIWMIAVFCLSNQQGEDSGNLSRIVANFFAHGDTVKAESLEPLIRKVAHMTEYAVGAMIFYGITITYPEMSRKKRLILTFAYIILYAASDEFHQLFIDERNGSVVDVFIDTFGAALGIIGMLIIEFTIITMDNKVKEDLKKQKIENK